MDNKLPIKKKKLVVTLNTCFKKYYVIKHDSIWKICIIKWANILKLPTSNFTKIFKKDQYILSFSDYFISSIKSTDEPFSGIIYFWYGVFNIINSNVSIWFFHIVFISFLKFIYSCMLLPFHYIFQYIYHSYFKTW